MQKSQDINLAPDKVLMKAYCRENRNRNRVLYSAIIIAITVMFCIISLIYGKGQVDIIRNIRADGMNVSTYLENGTESSSEQLQALSYVRKIGLEKSAGKLMNSGQTYAVCKVLDETAYEEMVSPAFPEIHGTYPKNANEIMLSDSILEYLGIKRPKIGMQILLEFYWDDLFCDAGTGLQHFILSGYYVDEKNEGTGNPSAYISQKRLDDALLEMYPCRILIDTDTHFLSGGQLEKILYRDVVLAEKQQIVSNDSPAYRAMEGIIGGVGLAVLFSIMILFALFLLVFNVLYISMDKDIRQYGLLEVLGVEKKEIKKIVYNQMGRICLLGSITAIVLNGIFIMAIYPFLMKRSLDDFSISGFRLFFLFLLLGVCIVICCMVFLAVSFSLKKLLGLAPIQAMKYEDVDIPSQSRPQKRIKNKGKHTKRSVLQEPIWLLAWGNVTRTKKKLIFTVLSLAIGCQIAIASAMLVRGTDFMNKLQKNADFQISLTQNVCRSFIESSGGIQQKKLFTDGLLTQLVNRVRIKKDDMSERDGFFPIIDKEGQESLQVLNESEDPLTIIQSLDDNEMNHLESYLKTHADYETETFLHKNGVLILHNHLLSEQNVKAAKENMGKGIGVYDLVPVGTEMSEQSAVSLTNCGYIDISDKRIADIDLIWDAENTIYLIVSNDTFQTLSKELTKQVFQVTLNVSDSDEQTMKEEIKQWVRETNIGFQNKINSKKMDLLSLQCNSDLIAAEKSYVLFARLLMWTVSVFLIFMGIVNYVNTVVTDLIARKRELALMEIIGVTRRQLNRMLTLEGLFYCVIAVALMGTIGNGLLYLLCIYMRNKITYFEVRYPLDVFVGIICILAFFSILIPRFIFKWCLRAHDIGEINIDR